MGLKDAMKEYLNRHPRAKKLLSLATVVAMNFAMMGSGSAVLFGAVVTDEGGPVKIGSDCVIMENAVLRGTPKHPL